MLPTIDRNNVSAWAKSQDPRCRDYGALHLQTETARRLRECYRRKAIELAQFANDCPNTEVIFTTKDKARQFLGDAVVCKPYFETDNNGASLIDIDENYVPCVEYIKNDDNKHTCVDYTVYLSSIDNRCMILIEY